MRLVEGVIVFLCVGASMCAQQQPIAAQEIERAQRLLGSNLWVDKAWGAYFAGRLHSKELEQPLIEQFRISSSLHDAPSYSEARDFVAALFDAAIESGITVPAALLEPYEKDWPDPVVILLARDLQTDDAEDALMRFRVSESRNSLWLAVNNLLFERKSEKWYAAVLGEMTVTHLFSITDPNRFPAGQGGRFGGGWRDGVAGMPRGFPPVGLYKLQDRAEKGSVLLARGPSVGHGEPHHAYYMRTVVPLDGQVGSYSSDASDDRMEIRIGYLAELGDVSVREAQRLFRAETHIVYTNAADFEAQAREAMDTQEHGIRKLKQDIAQRGLRAPGVRLRIEPKVEDDRTAPDAPLPPVAPREIDLP